MFCKHVQVCPQAPLTYNASPTYVSQRYSYLCMCVHYSQPIQCSTCHFSYACWLDKLCEHVGKLCFCSRVSPTERVAGAGLMHWLCWRSCLILSPLAARRCLTISIALCSRMSLVCFCGKSVVGYICVFVCTFVCFECIRVRTQEYTHLCTARFVLKMHVNLFVCMCCCVRVSYVFPERVYRMFRFMISRHWVQHVSGRLPQGAACVADSVQLHCTHVITYCGRRAPILHYQSCICVLHAMFSS